MPIGFIVFSTRDSAFEAPEGEGSASGLSSDEVRSALNSLDFTLRPSEEPAPPATAPAGDDSAAPESTGSPAARPDVTAASGGRATNAPGPATSPADGAPGTAATSGDDPEAISPTVPTSSPYVVVSPIPTPVASGDADAPPPPEPGGEEGASDPGADETWSAVVPMNPDDASPAPSPRRGMRSPGPVVCELVDVVLAGGEGAGTANPSATEEGNETDPITFNPMSLTIRGSERLVVVADDDDIRRQIFDCLGGLSVPASGSVQLFGHDSGQLSPDERGELRRRQIGLLHPELPLLSALTLEENLRLALELCADPDSAERLQELVDRFDLEECRHDYPSECAMDARIRAGLARALASRPLCLVADMVEGTVESDRTRALAALIAGLENLRTTAILMLPMREIPDWVDRAVQISATGMTELERMDPATSALMAGGLDTIGDPDDAGVAADDAPDPAPELEEAA